MHGRSSALVQSQAANEPGSSGLFVPVDDLEALDKSTQEDEFCPEQLLYAQQVGYAKGTSHPLERSTLAEHRIVLELHP